MTEFNEQRIIHSDQSGDFKMDVTYEQSHNFNIRVTQISTGKQLFTETPAMWEPRFGLDVDDLYSIAVEAEKLCEELENV